MHDYGFVHDGKVFTPDGTANIDASESDARNRETERAEIQWLQTGPEKVFLYVKMPQTEPFASRSWTRGDSIAGCCKVALAMHAIRCPICGQTSEVMQARADKATDITTWLGTPVASHVAIGQRVNVGGIAGQHSYKRAVSCRIFGKQYHGWYYESAGSYCHLKLAKRQPK